MPDTTPNVFTGAMNVLLLLQVPEVSVLVNKVVNPIHTRFDPTFGASELTVTDAEDVQPVGSV